MTSLPQHRQNGVAVYNKTGSKTIYYSRYGISLTATVATTNKGNFLLYFISLFLSLSLSLSLSRSSALHTIDRKSKKSQSAFETHVLRIGSRIANAEPRSCCTTSRNIANTLFSSKRNVRGIIPGGLFPLRFRRVVSGG